MGAQIRALAGGIDIVVATPGRLMDLIRRKAISLAMVEILEGAAQHFDVRIEDEDAKLFVRVQDLVDYISSRLG